MILATIFRNIVKSALSSDVVGSYTTMAENRVYDTRLEDFTNNTIACDASEPKPHIGVYTTDVSLLGDGRTSARRSGKKSIALNLNIEYAIYGYNESAGAFETNGGFLAAVLDLMGEQIHDSLLVSPSPQAETFLSWVAGSVDFSFSDSFFKEANTHIAVRTMEASIKLRPEKDLSPVLTGDVLKTFDLYAPYHNLINCDNLLTALRFYGYNEGHDALDINETSIDGGVDQPVVIQVDNLRSS